jgi:tetratricopeptide (TPR) repeat protein
MRSVFIIALACLLTSAMAQKVQELESTLVNLKDTARVRVLIELSMELARNDSAKAFQYAKEALELAHALHFHEGIAGALRSQSIATYFTNNHTKAIELLQKSSQYAEEHKCWEILSQNYENLAGIYSSIMANHNIALDYYLKAYAVYEQHLPNGPKYVALLGIASSYKNQVQYDKAIEYIKKAIPLIEANNDERNKGVALENMAEIYWLLKDLPKAKNTYTEALAIFEKLENTGGQIFCLTGLANVTRELGDYQQSMQYGKEALELSGKLPRYERAKLYGLESVGKTQYTLGQYGEAQSNFEEGLAIALKLHMGESIRDFYKELALVASAQKDFKKAYEYESRFSLYADSVLNKEMSQQLSEVRTRFETEKQEAEIEILKRDNQISKFYFITAMASLVGVIAFGYLIITRQRLKNRKDREVADIQTQALEARKALVEAELKNKELSEAKLRDQLEYKNKELTTYTLNLIQKNESLENIKKLVEEMRLLPEGEVRPKLTTLINTVNYSFNLDRDWESFKLHFENVHQGFFDRLLRDYPDLNGNDLKLCALMKLNMETKEIATVMDISPESVKVARHRLRKKLNLATEQNLSSVLVSY